MTEVLIKVGLLAGAALTGAITFTIMDVKGASWMQRRPGPLHVGLRGFISVSYTHLTLPTKA